jgi:hypothetical protein
MPYTFQIISSWNRDLRISNIDSFGMIKRQVLASDWGQPSHVTTEQTPTGTVDLWMYGGGNFLAFRNGHLEEVLNDM